MNPRGELAFLATEVSLQSQALNFNLGPLSLQNGDEHAYVLYKLPSEILATVAQTWLRSPGLELSERVIVEGAQECLGVVGVN